MVPCIYLQYNEILPHDFENCVDMLCSILYNLLIVNIHNKCCSNFVESNSLVYYLNNHAWTFGMVIGLEGVNSVTAF